MTCASAGFDHLLLLNGQVTDRVLPPCGLEGIREGLDPGRPHAGNMCLHGEADPLARAVFDPLMTDARSRCGRDEWRAHHTHVSQWKLDRYLKFF